MSTAIIAITTSSSINVNPRRLDKQSPPHERSTNGQAHTCEIMKSMEMKLRKTKVLEAVLEVNRSVMDVGEIQAIETVPPTDVLTVVSAIRGEARCHQE